MQNYKPVKSGKVREIYETDNNLIMVATDRISAFDVILKNEIRGKGKILTRISGFWFDFTKDILPNHLISTDVNDMPEFFRDEKFEGRTMLVKKLRMIPVECIVRGYITGSGWESYKESGSICGIKLPDGLMNCDRLPEPIYTPSTKAEIGTHDENIRFEESASILNREFPGKGKEYAGRIRDYTLAIYKKCADFALTRGIIIADTKFEFGLDENDEIVLADEVLTPDSSRFWPKEGYKPGKSQPSFDKQFVRDYLKENPACNYNLPDDIIEKTIGKYKEAYRLLSGREIEL